MRKLLMAGVALGFGLAMTASAALADIQIGCRRSDDRAIRLFRRAAQARRRDGG